MKEDKLQLRHHEIDDIANMLKIAQNRGLEVEVIWSFAKEIRDGEQDLAQAAVNALCEWDI